jgi:hypothetical protein
MAAMEGQMVCRQEEQDVAVQAVEAEADMVQAVNEPIERLQVCQTNLSDG